MPQFDGTPGDDTADVSNAGTLIGFTGGTIAQLQDGIGDVFNCLAGSDIVVAGSGDDTIFKNSGTADFDGGAGNDKVQITSFLVSGSVDGGADTDTLRSDTNTLALQIIVFSNIEILEAFNFIGRAAQFEAADTLRVNPVLFNTAVNITLIASGGSTVMDLSDELGGAAGRGATIVGSADNETIKGNLVLSNALNGAGGNDVLNGGSARDILTGGIGNDRLLGGVGNDTLTGGAGKDTMTGGANRDFFDFNAKTETVKGANRDVIVDFNRGADDRIDLVGIDADTSSNPGNDKFKFIGTAAFKGGGGELRCKNGIIQGDINGDKVADFEIKVNVASMVSGDFFL